jgi:hypothetical protein
MRPPIPTRRAGAPDPRRVGPCRSARAGDLQPPSAVLGPDHPLTRAIDAVERVRKQSVAVAAVLVGSLADLSAGAVWAAALALSATVVLLGLIFAIAAFRQRERDRALDLILEGRERVPIAPVQRERRRLGAPRTKRRMACTIEGMLEQTMKPPAPCARSARPFFRVAVVASVADDLHAICQLLRTDHASVRGVALTERLLTDGRSPFYGNEAALLIEELHRIQRAMSA